MTTKAFEGPAFGSQSARFNLNGIHPNLLNTGKMPYDTKTVTQTNLGPGSYDLQRYAYFSDLNVSRRADGPNWERGALTEKLAKMPHLLYQEAYKKKKELKKELGPGYYNIGPEVMKSQSNRGMLDTLSDRFAYERINLNPGPGVYGVPDEKLEAKRKNKPGKVPLMERSKEPRSLPSVGCEVPPATYNLKSSIDELVNKKVGNRGPYDVFSENRSAPMRHGLHAQDLDMTLGPGQYNTKSFTDNLNDYSQAKHGKFGKIDQYPSISGDRLSINNTSIRPRNTDPNWPGPGSYSPGTIPKPKNNTPSFFSSTKRTDKRSQAFFNRNFNSVGVGRYDIQTFDDSEFKNGHKSVFLSKSAQITDPKIEKYLGERLKAHNLSTAEKRNLYLTGNV